MVDFCDRAGHVSGMDDIIDTRGLKCPLPVLKLGKVLRGVPVGSIVTLWADDPVAVIDIPHFCVEAGHELVSQTADTDFQTYVVKRG